MKQRTRDFALRVVKLAAALPRERGADVFARQMIRSASSTAANYRAACRSRSRAEFIAKLGIVEEEADETSFWIGMTRDSGLVKPQQVRDLLTEADEIVAMIVASRKTTRANAASDRPGRRAN
ncbi:MAG: four helix bundle protein [Phycisphaerae bacterium]